jgi:membrane associated rhomboid family serine protease
MQEDPSTASPAVEFCYRHPTEATRVHCTRCGRPICTDCMIPAPVGHQCPECVELARKEFRQGPVQRIRSASGLSVTRIVLVVLFAAYIVEVSAGGAGSLISGPNGQVLFDLGAMFPRAIALQGQYWRLFSATLLHAGLLHIGLNAYALWLFGSLVETTFGKWRFALIYLVSAFLGSAASYTFGPVIALGVGASGAIVGLFGAFIAYNLRRRHLAQAAGNLRWAATIILINAVIGFGFPGVDWRAHVGGLLAGVATGAALDGIGPQQYRRIVAVAGTAAVVLLGILLVAWRTEQIRSLLGAG